MNRLYEGYLTPVTRHVVITLSGLDSHYGDFDIYV